MKYTWVCVYVPVNVASRKGREEIRKFWNYVNNCLRNIESGRRAVLDMKGRVGNCEVAWVV